ncbi:MAG: Zn-dependent hydrolase [Candidatus Binatia bacterium]
MNGAVPDGARLADELQTLADFRDPARPGFTRRPFTKWYEDARRWIAERMRAAGLDVRIDAVGNVIGKRQGTKNLPAIMLGSHIDTVDGGGRFDGMVGVLGAVELARCLEGTKAALAHPVEIVSFFAEEPTDFGVSAVGSRAMAGVLDGHLLQQTDPTGQTLGAALTGSGYDARQISQARRRAQDISVYLELHIEQGPRLEQMGKAVGVVSTITGFRRHRFTWSGRADHAGTMPMGLRKDALAGACESILDIELRCRREADTPLVGTVARISVWPNATNVVPDRVEFISDIRSPSAGKLELVCKENAEHAKAIASARGLNAEITQITAELPIEVPSLIRAQATAALRDLDLESVELVSMAGHDANQLARIVPAGMLFIRCKDGRSHCPEEESSIEDICLGVATLFELVRRLDQEMC